MHFNDRVSINLADTGVAQVRFTRGDKMNALDPAQFAAIIEAGEALRTMKGLRAVVLSGEGGRSAPGSTCRTSPPRPMPTARRSPTARMATPICSRKWR